MRKKGMLAIEIMVIMILAVIVLAVLVGVIIFGGQKPTGDLAKQTFVRSCCQLNMPLTCTNPSSVNCVVPKELQSSFPCTESGGKCVSSLTSAADKIGITSGNVKTFCGCG